MSIRILETDLHILNMRTRMPFKYGIATLTALPHLFVRVKVEIAGEAQWGIAADGLPPKWFTKNPDTHFQDDLAEMFDVIQAACRLAKASGASESVFALWQQIYAEQKAWATTQNYPPLLWSFGVSLVERAIIDAFCRATETSFAKAVRTNTLGIMLDAIHPELQGFTPAELLPTAPRRQITLRHTVGLADPLRDDDIAEDERIDDGLPQSLVACVRTYGLTHFKIKVNGNIESDLMRLQQIATILEEYTPAYRFTLDGNEQYKSVAAFQDFWKELQTEMPDFLRHLIFVEQPFHRDIALDDDVQQQLIGWSARPPIIIDEADGDLASLPRALQCGYSGTSHKNCKGVFKGLANAALLEHRRRTTDNRVYLISGEDLANVGPVALLQDLAVLATLGVEHAERNGHHYFAGLRMLPQAIQQQMLAEHGDLYHQGQQGFPTLAVKQGIIQLSSVVDALFGLNFLLDSSQFTPLVDWRFNSL